MNSAAAQDPTESERRAAILDFPAVPHEYVAAGNRWVSDKARALMEELHPLLGSVPRQAVGEMPDFIEESPNDGGGEGDEASIDYRQFAHGHETTISVDTALDFDIDQVLVLIYQLADSLGGQMTSDMIRMMSDAAEASGNVVRMGDSGFWESFITSLEAMEVDFDEQGEHNLSFVTSPNFAEHLRENPPTAEQTERMDALMKAKREESRASRGRRRLS